MHPASYWFSLTAFCFWHAHANVDNATTLHGEQPQGPRRTLPIPVPGGIRLSRYGAGVLQRDCLGNRPSQMHGLPKEKSLNLLICEMGIQPRAFSRMQSGVKEIMPVSGTWLVNAQQIPLCCSFSNLYSKILPKHTEMSREHSQWDGILYYRLADSGRHFFFFLMTSDMFFTNKFFTNKLICIH